MPSSRIRRRDADLGAAPASPTSVVRTGLCLVLALLGIAWLVVYTAGAAPDDLGVAPTKGLMGQLADLGHWNYLIGFGLLLLGLALAAHPSTPLGRGRGVVIGMLGCFLVGLVWIVVYYVTGSITDVPLVTDLAQYNLVVGIGFFAVGFVYATHWE